MHEPCRWPAHHTPQTLLNERQGVTLDMDRRRRVSVPGYCMALIAYDPANDIRLPSAVAHGFRLHVPVRICLAQFGGVSKGLPFYCAKRLCCREVYETLPGNQQLRVV